MASKTSVPHLDHVECGHKRVLVDMYVELYGTGKLPRKYEVVLEEYFKTTDKREMLRKALRSKVVPVMCPNKTVELVDVDTGDMMKKFDKEHLDMGKSREARIAANLVARMASETGGTNGTEMGLARRARRVF